MATDVTPQKARRVVTKLSPSSRRGLAVQVHQALRAHRDVGDSEFTRFCTVPLDALEAAEYPIRPSANPLADADRTPSDCSKP